jgi:hypothetical protein
MEQFIPAPQKILRTEVYTTEPVSIPLGLRTAASIANPGSGIRVGVSGFGGLAVIAAPEDYVSGNPLSFT